MSSASQHKSVNIITVSTHTPHNCRHHYSPHHISASITRLASVCSPDFCQHHTTGFSLLTRSLPLLHYWLQSPHQISASITLLSSVCSHISASITLLSSVCSPDFCQYHTTGFSLLTHISQYHTSVFSLLTRFLPVSYYCLQSAHYVSASITLLSSVCSPHICQNHTSVFSLLTHICQYHTTVFSLLTTYLPESHYCLQSAHYISARITLLSSVCSPHICHNHYCFILLTTHLPEPLLCSVCSPNICKHHSCLQSAHHTSTSITTQLYKVCSVSSLHICQYFQCTPVSSQVCLYHHCIHVAYHIFACTTSRVRTRNTAPILWSCPKTRCPSPF